MKAILVANPKGGSGKSTLATHVAAHFAWEGEQVMLGDLDRQHTARHWLSLRPDNFPRIHGWELAEGLPAQPPPGTTVAVLDSPAGLHGKKLDTALKVVERVLVPVQPASFDLWALADFFQRLAEEKAVRKGRVEIAVIGMRVNPRTQTFRRFQDFVADYRLPLLTSLRDTQLYVQLQPRGLTLFDLPRPRFERDFAQWQPIIEWLK
ncbi:cobyrinic acid a,c-diamide synthase [Chitiniphilus shinanonensis]|uniref:Cobyrinic acid a,c-diamide synthase n=1 Tax=Chitiniphilus shinanonensis TaxID=553088 RepID=A0ABQ6BPU9_9NEIS|nr:division plane positioning ATPase MipZ [Chitiniphilus shinanonensis]GLS04060.1 cobyrinic acid a,c-diamide synthase [Chitiniphilus shinanonensis]